MAKRVAVILLMVLLASFISIAVIPTGWAVAQPTTVFVDPPSVVDQSLVPNTKFQVYVKVANIPADPTNKSVGVVGVEFKLSWDPTILNCTSIKENMFHEVTPEDFWSNIWSLKLTFNNTGGYLNYAQTWQDMTAALSDGYAAITGNHIMANITFNVKAVGKTDLHFAASKLADVNAQSIVHTTVDGFFDNRPVAPPPKPALLYVDPAKIVDSSLTSGSSFTINIGIVNASGVGGLEFKLGFNASVLQVSSVARGSFIPSSVTPNIQVDNASGFAKFNVSLPTPLDGNGVVAIIQFKVQADEVRNSPLHLYDVVLVDSTGESLPFTTADGNFTNSKTLVGDFNADGIIDIKDAVIAATYYGTTNKDAKWNQAQMVDVNSDGEIDIFDMILLCHHFGEKL